MRIVFASNYFNHHQKPVCDALHQRLGDGFHFVATMEVPQVRRSLGYSAELPEYVIPAYADPRQWELAQRLIDEADVVISGSAPESMLRSRIRAGKLLFRYSERPLKDGFSVVKYLPRLIKWHLRSPMTKPIYMLCASAFSSSDYAKFGLFLGRCYKWGYFPETKRYPAPDAMIEKKDPTAILWVARMLKLKHPDDALEAARRLKQEGKAFTLTMIGIGPMEPLIRERIEEYGLSDCVSLPGSMSPEEVRRHMERCGIFLFTSDRQEGWGAVLNESMNSGCAVVGSDAIGSVPYLIRSGENGLTYTSGDVDELYRLTAYLLDHPQEQRRLGTAAYRSITEHWNAEIAAERLLQLAQQIMSGEKHPDLFADGPASLDTAHHVRMGL